MINLSKKNDPRFWKIWEESGAIGTIVDAKKRKILSYPSKQYIHTNHMDGKGLPELGLNGKYEYVIRNHDEKLIPFNDLNILVVQVDKISNGKHKAYVIVPGYFKSKETILNEKNRPLNITNVIPMKDKEDKSKLKNIIEQSTKGPINFW